MSIKRALMIGVLAIAALAAGAYVYFYGKEYVYRFTEAQLQQALSERMPLEKTYLFVLNVRLENPRIALVEGSDRVNAGLDVTVHVALSDEPLTMRGSIDASGGIRYDNTTGQFFLTDPVVEQLDVQGIPPRYTARVNGSLSDALRDYYATHPVYTLRGDDPQRMAARLVLKTVVVENQQLVVTLGVGNR